ncbi:hypothetical protein XELAEV_18009581mg [Xenopus laevis]|uniref:Uncharacterized protein n=1 Tax=Xenopus laevis TaxID=8355 RepID=A0A974DSU3_XENLA|nr:hypothetical protein XELAEV_18009581mg [Xenopus laevis]
MLLPFNNKHSNKLLHQPQPGKKIMQQSLQAVSSDHPCQDLVSNSQQLLQISKYRSPGMMSTPTTIDHDPSGLGGHFHFLACPLCPAQGTHNSSVTLPHGPFSTVIISGSTRESSDERTTTQAQSW